MKNHGLFSSLFIDKLKESVSLDNAAQGRLATLSQTWQNRDNRSTEALWESFLKQALGYLEFVPPQRHDDPGVYPLYENWNFNECISVLYLVSPGADIDDIAVGRFYPAKLLAQLKKRKLNWGILTDGNRWRLYSSKSSRPYEDYVELSLSKTLETTEESEYGLFERFFHKESFIISRAPVTNKTEIITDDNDEQNQQNESPGIEKCRLDQDREQSEKILEQYVKEPFLAQVDEVLQYICNGFIFDTKKSGEEYTEEERVEIFESAVKLIYRCLFLFYAEARRLLPTDSEKIELYRRHSIQSLCLEARKFRWGKRLDSDQYDLWKHLKGLINAVNDGDPEYGIMGYNGGLFDDEKERFLGKHQLRNDFLARALYLLAFVEPYNNEPDAEYAIPYEDLEVRHLGELYENILEFTVQLADADRIRRRTKKGTEILLASQALKREGDTLIKKGEVYFGESALERKQTGSFYTAESIVRFLNEKSIIQPLRVVFECQHRRRFNDLLEQAAKGLEAGTRRGAAQAAATLVERFAEQEVLNFKVCDPAMGSGHFLVDAANQMAGLVVSLLEEVPNVEGLTVSVSNHPNNWRRRITRHCIYGVDLNPLAVNLSKLSLWLNCFASEHKLTFLDHHLRCGNSLIGIRSLKQLASIPKRNNNNRSASSQQLLFDYDDLSSILANACKGISSITEIDEDDTDSQREVLQITYEAISDLMCLADLYAAYLVDYTITTNSYKELFEKLSKGKSAISSLSTALMETYASVIEHRISHHFYHWPLEFLEVFGTGTLGGFSAVVGNPPWDVVKPSSVEFFLQYDSSFRGYKTQKANQIVDKMIESDPVLREKWERYWNYFEEQRVFFREENNYRLQGKGDFNTFKLFLEQFYTLLRNNGYMGILVPSGIYTDEGCLPLREFFLNNSRINFLYCFENRWPTIFSAVDGRFKFVVFGTRESGKTDAFQCAFMEHDPDRLTYIDEHALKMKSDTVRTFSPDSLSLIEFKSQKEVDIAFQLYEGKYSLGPYLRNNFNTGFQREFHMTGDSGLFITNPNSGSPSILPLWEGKYFWILSDAFGEIKNWMTLDDARKKQTTSKTRVVYRALAASTNERTFISTVIPNYLPTGHTVNVCPLSPEDAVICTSILSSFVWDWLVRGKVTTSVSIFIIEPLPFPHILDKNEIISSIIASILARGSRLVCDSGLYSNVWNASFHKVWQSSDFWYPATAPIEGYGPLHEQEIRRRLRAQTRDLTPEWEVNSGVHDRLPNRRDIGDRAQLRAEIDAYVAYLYGLSRNDFAYILDTFPVLKKKEEKAFGEFMSKRKCLEEYDRLARVLGEKK